MVNNERRTLLFASNKVTNKGRVGGLVKDT